MRAKDKSLHAKWIRILQDMQLLYVKILIYQTKGRCYSSLDGQFVKTAKGKKNTDTNVDTFKGSPNEYQERVFSVNNEIVSCDGFTYKADKSRQELHQGPFKVALMVLS